MKTDMRKIRSRQYLIDGLLTLMEKSDLQTISVNDIVQEAKVARSTFYAQFEDKPYFIRSIIEEMLEDLRSETWPGRDEKTGCLEQESHDYYEKHFAYIIEHAVFFKAMMGKHGTPLFRQRLEESARITYDDILSQFGDEELPIPRAYFIQYIISAHIGITSKWIEDGLKYSAAYMAKLLTDLTFHGLLHGLEMDKAVTLPK